MFVYGTWTLHNMWTDCMRNGEILEGVKEERNIIRTEKRRKDHCIGHTMRSKSVLK